MKELIGVLLLTFPLLWELWNDKDGDSHISRGPLELPSKKVDILVRITIASVAAIINLIINDKEIFKSVTLCSAVHFLLFDYLIAYILAIRGVIKGHWWSYMGSKGIDNFPLWKHTHPIIKLIIRLMIFIIASIVYFS